MIITLIIITLLGTFYMTALSRMSGGGLINLPFGLDQWLYAIPYGVLGFLALLSTSGPIGSPYPWWVWVGALASFLIAFIGKRSGHGQWMDLGTYKKIIKPEKLDFLVKLFWGRDKNETTVGEGNYWRDFTGLAVSGVFVTLGAFVCLIVAGHLWLGFGVLLGGLWKAPSYSIGWLTGGFAYEELNEPTEVGEALTGLFGGLPVFYAIAILLLTTFL